VDVLCGNFLVVVLGLHFN